MDVSNLTPESVLAVEFREKLRGYHQDDVDEFLERIAAGVRELRARLDAAEAQAASASTRTPELSDGEESLRRTLVLAQRTADMAIREARDQAAQIVAEAQEQAARMLEQADADLVSEVQRLAAARERLAADVRSLEAWLSGERAKLREALASSLQQLDQGVPLLASAPAIEPVELPASAQRAAAPDAGAAPAAAAPVEEAALEVEHDDEDAFLAELRRAVTDETPLGPREDPPAGSEGDPFQAFVDLDGHDDDGGGLGGRLRRRRS